MNAPYALARMAIADPCPHDEGVPSRFRLPMPASVLDFLSGGLLQLGWGELLIYLLVAVQITIFAVTL